MFLFYFFVFLLQSLCLISFPLPFQLRRFQCPFFFLHSILPSCDFSLFYSFSSLISAFNFFRVDFFSYVDSSIIFLSYIRFSSPKLCFSSPLFFSSSIFAVNFSRVHFFSSVDSSTTSYYFHSPIISRFDLIPVSFHVSLAQMIHSGMKHSLDSKH